MVEEFLDFGDVPDGGFQFFPIPVVEQSPAFVGGMPKVDVEKDFRALVCGDNQIQRVVELT